MKDSARCLKIVEWFDGDHWSVVRCPGLLGGGCHGDDEVERRLLPAVRESAAP